MSDKELSEIKEGLAIFNQAATAIKGLVRAMWGVGTIVVIVTVWVYATNASIAKAQEDIEQIKAARILECKDYTEWRISHEKMEAQEVTMMNDLKQMVIHQQEILDRLTLPEKK